ncbi:YjgB family protein [Neobacillus jeddahensis]|uniref:YjgB family protein n=1 Tax=Neobacillus jeddahensis TaxID=1461580 RepID=UPI0006933CB4|nr:YjgB family protein [Neobacillus jeddahensis]
MKNLLKIGFIPCLFALLIGCTHQEDTQSSPPPSKQTSPSSSSSHSSSQTDEPEKPSEKPSGNVSEKPSSNPSTSEPSQTGDSQQASLIQETVKLAKEGSVKNCIFPVETTTFEQITAKWGEPDQLDFVAGNRYATYTSRGIVFGINKGEQIFDVRSNAKELQQLTFEQIKQELGKPDDTRTSSGDTIWVYNVTDKFQLKFVGSKATIDHISVYCPRDAKNQMAG